MSALQVVDALTMLILGVTAGLGVARVLRDCSLPDKVIGADLAVVIMAAAVAAGAALTDDTTFLDVLVVLTVIGFVSMVTVARFVEKRGPRT